MQLELLKGLQNISNPFLDKLFYWITNLGDTMFYIIAITFIYWCINSRFAIKLLFVTLISYMTNSGLKQLFHIQRPFYTEGIYTTEQARISGYSFPSGHTQGATVFWLYLMIKTNKKVLNIIGGIIIAFVAFSRIYLRVHWPIDIIGGFLIGVVLIYIMNYLITIIEQNDLGKVVILMFVVVCLAIIIFLKFDLKITKLLILFISTMIGYMLKSYFINYSENTSIKNQFLKCSLGFAVIFLIKYVLKNILPDIILLHYIRYFILGLWVTLFAPIVFIKLKLSE